MGTRRVYQYYEFFRLHLYSVTGKSSSLIRRDMSNMC
jgi:hypothetical protein